jgi:hypothetical protein
MARKKIGQTKIKKTLHKKLKIDQYVRTPLKLGLTLRVSISAPLVTPIVLLLNESNII